jgi:hypothetical protein
LDGIGLQSPWREKLVGPKLLKTKISPETRYIDEGSNYKVTIKCDVSDAVLRYTTDGSEPTVKSAQYKSPIEFSSPVFIRAKAFKRGFIDLSGAAEFYANSIK